MHLRQAPALATMAGALLLAACGGGGNSPTATPDPNSGPRVTLEAVADTTIFEEGPLGNGAGEWFFAGSTNRSVLRRGLLRFEVADQIPPAATVTAAQLILTQDRARTIAPAGTSIHRALAAWAEGSSDAAGQEGRGVTAQPGDATWEHAVLGEKAWSIPGGDWAVDPSAVTDVSANGTYTWSSPGLIEDVQSWIDGTAENLGWFIIGDEETTGSARRFLSRESEAGGAILIIEYAAP